MTISATEINQLVDKMQHLVTEEADRRGARGMSHAEVTALVMTIGAHIAARCVALCAMDQTDPRVFCREAAPILAEQITEAATVLAVGATARPTYM